ncbi:hypothetical protein, partial [Corallococcus sp. 4LFB]|uniref:hypothetical protein n=1 Tax=Corallococcus sp. 4LFB TaxID=3383249 RepID=UPI0039769012
WSARSSWPSRAGTPRRWRASTSTPGAWLVRAAGAGRARAAEQARERARVAGWREGEALAAQVLGTMDARTPRR